MENSTIHYEYLNELNSLINLATDFNSPVENLSAIGKLTDFIRKQDSEGCNVATLQLLAKKIQSPVERESLYAIFTINLLAKRCGPNFHSELGKFRFLNDLIKVLSPKYLGAQSTSQVKLKIIESLESWCRMFPKETKILEACNMLKSQGLWNVSKINDSTLHNSNPNDEEMLTGHSSASSNTTAAPRPPPVPSIFDKNAKAKELSRLLKSRHVEDLQAANRLIKIIVQEDNQRIEAISRRLAELETVRNNCRLIDEMVAHWHNNHCSPQPADVETMEQLAGNLRQSKSLLIDFCQQVDDTDEEAFEELIAVSELIDGCLQRHSQLTEQGLASTADPQTADVDSLLDLHSQDAAGEPDLLANELRALGIAEASVPAAPNDLGLNPSSKTAGEYLSDVLLEKIDRLAQERSVAANQVEDSQLLGSTDVAASTCKLSDRAFEELDQWSKSFFNVADTVRSAPISTNLPHNENCTLLDLDSPNTINTTLLLNVTTPPQQPIDDQQLLNPVDLLSSSTTGDSRPPSVNLNQLAVPNLASIRPHPLHMPIRVFTDDNQVSLHLHFTDDKLDVALEDGGCAQVLILVGVVSNANCQPIGQINLQCVLPKSCQILVVTGADSADHLPGYSAFVPSNSVQRIILVHNPLQQSLRLKFHLSYQLEEEIFYKTATIDSLAIR